MLDFSKLIHQIEQIGRDSLLDSPDERQTLANALAVLDETAGQPEKFAHRLDENRGHTFWPLATPLEDFGNVYKVGDELLPITVAAVDGSQIMPSHHEVHSCYLLNVGLAVIGYGTNHPPVMESIPQLFHRSEDLYPLIDHRRVHIDEAHVSLERTLFELRVLLERSTELREKNRQVVALFDGSLIAWPAQQLPPAHQQRYHDRFSEILEGFQKQDVPLIGYLSHSRATDVVSMLRVAVCPYDRSTCREHCGHLDEDRFPCSTIWPLSDRILLSGRLDPGYRSCVFQSGARASNRLPEALQICICYINTGAEVSRLEFPAWLYSDTQLFSRALATVLSQSRKGMGYPIALSEAHHLAVIKSQDRDRFFDLITKHLVSLGVQDIRVSPKESKKRTGFV